MTDIKVCSAGQELTDATASTPNDAGHADVVVPSNPQTLQMALLPRPGTKEGASPFRAPAGRAQSISQRNRKARRLAAGRDRRQKVLMAMIPVLALTLVFVLKNPLKVSSAAPGPGASLNGAAPAASDDVEIAWELPPLYQPGGRDPMRLPSSATEEAEEPVAAAVETRADLIVTGILYSDDRPMAIIDEHLVSEGQQISGATVRKIEKDGIQFEMNGRTWKQAVEK